ncbi:MAG TPA: metal-sulfur cluster assembly factor [Patescibacteria group bacterium]|nr:metal-sulfur cluster assembly factor [Patescibacteria group bacterium]
MPQLKEKIMSKLGEVMDPELFISIVDLGLVYKVSESKGVVDIEMTLTSMGCPLFETIENDIKSAIKKIEGVKETRVRLVFDPPWSMDRLTERARAVMGI